MVAKKNLFFIAIIVALGVIAGWIFLDDENEDTDLVVDCSGDNLDFSKKDSYIECEFDEDCLSETCGCLNKKGTLAYNELLDECDVTSGCISPENCYCNAGKCGECNSICLVSDKMKYGVGEEVKLDVINKIGYSIMFYSIGVEKIEGNNGVSVRRDLECPCGAMCSKEGLMQIVAGGSEEFFWKGDVDTWDVVGCGDAEPGRYRFVIKNPAYFEVYGQQNLNEQYYSNIFEIE